MLATQDKYIDEATVKLHKLIEDQKFRDQLWAREDYIRREKYKFEYLNGEIDVLKKSNSEKDTIIADRNITIAEQSTTIAEQSTTMAEQSATISDMTAKLADKDAEIATLRARLAEKNQ